MQPEHVGFCLWHLILDDAHALQLSRSFGTDPAEGGRVYTWKLPEADGGCDGAIALHMYDDVFECQVDLNKVTSKVPASRFKLNYALDETPEPSPILGLEVDLGNSLLHEQAEV